MNRIELDIAIDAPPSRVWACLTDPAAVRVWFGAHMALDARPGGGFREVWRDGAREVVTAGRVLDFDPPSRLVLSWADADWPAETRVTLVLNPEGTGTRLRLTHEGWAALGDGAKGLAAAHRAGWQAHLAALAAHAAAPAAGAIALRAGRAGEAGALHALAIRSKAHWGYDAAFMAQAAPKLALAADLFAAGRVAVADLDGRPAGVAALRAPDAGGVAELKHLFVDPPCMGRGVGRALLDWAAGRARAEGARALRVLSDPQAAGFYAAQGFRHAGDAPSDAIAGRMLPVLVRAL
ncbi:GNAT family N-acetyltransferase [Tabrizicola flagellatus]|uniref:GNAT family N-acetyltransferase n=1 Tax=Tabrizicola flagellatus TaxID=2593021 RepID=UPI0011F29C93|nr:GNAT family N-acetyltransferase [Tabrizicola flagellatus]